MNVVVTGAAGKTGRAVVAALAAQGVDVTALVHRDGDVPGAARVVVADMADSAGVFAGVDAVYHVPPNMHPREDDLSAAVIAAAERAGVARFVLHSVLAPYLPAMPHHVRKARAEVMLRGSGLRWTILQPASYAQNLLPFLDDVRATGVLRVPYSVHAPFTPVDLADVAEAAALVLTGDGHEYASYELAGPELLGTADMAAVLGALLGREVHAVGAPPPSQSTDLEAMFAWYDKHGLVGNSSVLHRLLGREPSTLAAALGRDLGRGLR